MFFLISVRRWFFALTVLSFLSGCRPDEFLYFQPALHPERVLSTFSIKEIIGGSSLDILWAIDNSGSMGDDQQNLILNSNLFITQLVSQNAFQWKIGMVSTHREDNAFLGFSPAPTLDNRTVDPVGVFNGAVASLTTNWGEPEESLSPMLIKLTAEPRFLSHAPLAIIIVSDSEEESPVSVKEFISEIQRLKGDDNFYVYAVLAFDALGCPGEDEIDWDHSKYKELVDRRKAKLYTLCDPNFGSNLADIGHDLATKIARPRIILNDRPVAESIRVIHRGVLLPGGPQADGGLWYYDFESNAVVFYDLRFAPTDNESVEISYLKDGFPRGVFRLL